jgi:hypothetical protein
MFSTPEQGLKYAPSGVAQMNCRNAGHYVTLHSDQNVERGM